MSGAYEGRQIVGMDLHRRRSVLVRMTETGDRLETVRISNDPQLLREVIARAGEAPEVVLEATYGWVRLDHPHRLRLAITSDSMGDPDTPQLEVRPEARTSDETRPSGSRCGSKADRPSAKRHHSSPGRAHLGEGVPGMDRNTMILVLVIIMIIVGMLGGQIAP